LRIKLELEKEGKDLTLPVHYNQIIQGMLYRSLPRLLAKFLHDVGFFHNNRPFKLFTFSKILWVRNSNINKTSKKTPWWQLKL
jgi:CRISPR-associated endoribonuclease Cas6